MGEAQQSSLKWLFSLCFEGSGPALTRAHQLDRPARSVLLTVLHITTAKEASNRYFTKAMHDITAEFVQFFCTVYGSYCCGVYTLYFSGWLCVYPIVFSGSFSAFVGPGNQRWIQRNRTDSLNLGGK